MYGGEKKHTVLIVDDEPGNITVLAELLGSEYYIRVATTGTKALEIAFSEEPPDLILLDIVLPGMDGFEVCQILKNDFRTQNIPIIFLTGKTGETNELKGFEAGAVDYVTKPFSAVIVKARVKTQLDLKKYRCILEAQSMQDGLTEIPNRRRFDEYLKYSWDLAWRSSSSISVIVIDIDNFKKYNDTYGHQAGDECLKCVAKNFEQTLRRKNDLVARYGGDEFVCILPATDLEGAVLVAENLRKNIADMGIPHVDAEHGILTISLGVASVVPAKRVSTGALLEAADRALYTSKEHGCNRVSTAPVK